jgi:hypothetical protein
MAKERIAFAPADDEELRALVDSLGDCNWKAVSFRMSAAFTARQCRERYRNYLSPHLASEPWTEDEDRRLLREFERRGTRWSLIAAEFPGRSGNTVRNRYFTLQRKTAKSKKQSKEPTHASARAEEPDQTPSFTRQWFEDFWHEGTLWLFFPRT